MEFQMSVKALTWAFEQPLAGNEKVVLLALADHADENGSCWPSMRRIAEKACIAERTVRRILIVLEEGGFLLVNSQHDPSGRSAPNRYELAMAGRVTNCQGGRVTLVSGGGDTVVRGEGDTVVTPYEPSDRTIKDSDPHIPLATEAEQTKDFEEFWNIYPKRPSNPKQPAWKSYLKARKSGATHAEIMAGLAAYARTRQGKDATYTAMGATWLNQERWKDDYGPAVQVRRTGNFV